MQETKITKGQQTREQVIEAAFRQFTANGFHGTSMRQIAEGAGLALGGIYNHFASKDEILKAVILAHHPLSVVLPALVEVQGDSAELLLRDAAQRLYAAMKARPEILNLLMIEILECRGRHLPDLLSEILPKAMGFVAQLQRLNSQLRLQSPMTVLRIFFGSLVGFLLTEAVLQQSPIPLDSIGTIDDWTDSVLHGLLKQ